MKGRNEPKVRTLRLLKAAIMKWEVAGAKKEASDEVVLDLIVKELKQRRDSIEQYEKGNRPDLVQKEQEEVEVLKAYLPESLTDEEIQGFIREAMQELHIVSKADFGKLMGFLMPKFKGKADGNVIRQWVEKLLP